MNTDIEIVLDRFASGRRISLDILNHIDDLISELSQKKIYSSLTNEEIKFLNNIQKARVRLDNCGKNLTFELTANGDTRLTKSNSCGMHLLCPICANRRKRLLVRKYYERYLVLAEKYPEHHLSFLTISIINSDDLEERLEHFKRLLKKLYERGNKARKGMRGWHSELKKFIASVGSIEATKYNGYDGIKKSGWHVHGHFIVMHDKTIDYNKFRAEINKITGDSSYFQIKRMDKSEDIRKEFMCAFSYSLKSSESLLTEKSLTPRDVLELFRVGSGKHFVSSFGEFIGCDIPETELDEETQNDTIRNVVYEFQGESGYV